MSDNLHPLQVMKQIHRDCHQLCSRLLGKSYGVAGNIGVFSRNDKDYKMLTSYQIDVTETSGNPNQKYFQLKSAIIIPAEGDIPESIYTYLYIRKPDPTPYGLYLGDIDFVLKPQEYHDLKNSLLTGAIIKGVEIYDRPGWDMLQLTDPGISSVAYLCTQEMAEKVRVRF